MINFQTALKIAKECAPAGFIVCNDDYGEIFGKYVFSVQSENGETPPWGGNITVDKESGKCKFEYLEREGDEPYSPILGYKKIIVKDL